MHNIGYYTTENADGKTTTVANTNDPHSQTFWIVLLIITGALCITLLILTHNKGSKSEKK